MSHSETEDQVTATDEVDQGADVTDEAVGPVATDPSTDTSTDTSRDAVDDDAVDDDAVDDDAVDDDAVDDDAVDDAAGAEGSDGADDDADDDADDADDAPDRLELEGDVAADYLEELLDIADLDGDLDMDVEGDRAVVSIVGADLNQLVGGRGEVLDALQELTRLAVYRETGERSRLMLDIGGHRARRREHLVALANDTVAKVNESGESVSLKAMSPFERKVVHDAVAAAGLSSESEGVEPRRFVVVLPK